MQKTILAIAAVIVVGVLTVAAYFAVKPALETLAGGGSQQGGHLSPAMLAIGGADIGGPFELTAHTGERMTEAQVIDRPTLIYFGYTFCPDICPIDVQVMVEAVDLLDNQGIDARPVFITVDPERDTPEELALYAEAMHPKMIALSGTQEDIRATARAFKVYYNRVDMEGSAAEYLMEHTGFIYLMTPEKGLTAMFRNGFPPEQLSADVEAVLSEL
jgi:protein SCO1/2